jgi:hypothetical protein
MAKKQYIQNLHHVLSLKLENTLWVLYAKTRVIVSAILALQMQKGGLQQ